MNITFHQKCAIRYTVTMRTFRLPPDLKINLYEQRQPQSFINIYSRKVDLAKTDGVSPDDVVTPIVKNLVLKASEQRRVYQYLTSPAETSLGRLVKWFTASSPATINFEGHKCDESTTGSEAIMNDFSLVDVLPDAASSSTSTMN